MSSTSAAIRGSDVLPRAERVEPRRTGLSRVGTITGSRPAVRAASPLRSTARRRADQTDGLLRQLIGTRNGSSRRAPGLVGQHHIKIERFKTLAAAPTELSRTAARVPLRPAEKRPQEFDLEVARQGRKCAHAQDLSRAAVARRSVREQIAARVQRSCRHNPARCDRLRSGAAAGRGARTARMAQTVLQLADLNRQGRLRQVQPRRVRVRFPSWATAQK